MKASKETKILAILLALFLLIGIGCGVAVATGGHSWQEVHGVVVTITTTGSTSKECALAEDSNLMENMAPIFLPGVIGTGV